MFTSDRVSLRTGNATARKERSSLLRLDLSCWLTFCVLDGFNPNESLEPAPSALASATLARRPADDPVVGGLVQILRFIRLARLSFQRGDKGSQVVLRALLQPLVDPLDVAVFYRRKLLQQITDIDLLDRRTHPQGVGKGLASLRHE